MAKNFIWDYQAAGDLMLRSEEMAQVCEEQAERMTRATGMEYKADVRVGKKRVRAIAKGNVNGTTVKNSKRFRNNSERKFERDPETGWPICPKCGEAHFHCTCWKKKG